MTADIFKDLILLLNKPTLYSFTFYFPDSFY